MQGLMAETLYDLLGVARDASLDEINRAYREKAKTMHPDTGGDAEQFKALVVAGEILRDPAKRAEYDRTGKTTNEPEQGPQRKALDLAMASIFGCIDHCLAQNVEPKHCEIIAMAKGKVRIIIGEMDKQIAQIEKRIRAEESLVGRFTVGAGEMNYCEAALNGRLASYRDGIEKQKSEREIAGRALDIIESYTFAAEPHPIQVSMNIVFSQTMRSAFTQTAATS
jgi:curved DNA-binding protein CbpA